MSMDPGKPDRMRRIWAERRAERIEQIEDMIEAGRTWEQICAAFGVTNGESFARRLSRWGRPDLTAAAKAQDGGSMAQRMRWKLQAKARLGLPANCSDHDFYREVARALKREDLIPRRDVDWTKPRRSKKARQGMLAAKGRRVRQRALPAALAERFPSIKDLEKEAA